jgi:hypothetical protein
MATKQADTTIYIEKVETALVEVPIVGTSPLICNRMSQKAKQELLLPKGRKTAAEKAVNLKHNPVEEYRASPYLLDGAPTLIGVMASALKGAMMTAALDLPGAKKAQIGRLVYVEGEYLPVYGVPRLFMTITRSADIDKTPDVRTRAILPRWATVARIRFVTPLLNATNILNLLHAAGAVAGIGDWRPEKGKGSFGQFRIANPGDEELAQIMAEGGYEAQHDALYAERPVCYDRESEELLGWFAEEVVKRGKSL